MGACTYPQGLLAEDTKASVYRSGSNVSYGYRGVFNSSVCKLHHLGAFPYLLEGLFGLAQARSQSLSGGLHCVEHLLGILDMLESSCNGSLCVEKMLFMSGLSLLTLSGATEFTPHIHFSYVCLAVKIMSYVLTVSIFSHKGIIHHVTTLQIYPVGYTKSHVTRPIKLLHLPYRHDIYQGIHQTLSKEWSLCYKMCSYVDKTV